jgi:hypothetical protein
LYRRRQCARDRLWRRRFIGDDILVELRRDDCRQPDDHRSHHRND